MKRALTMLLALVLLGALAACGQTPRPAEEDPLTLLRQEIADSGSQLGVAFLGVMKDTDGDMAAWLADSGWTQTFPFLTALTAEQTVSQPGNEVYCIVPADESACLTVRAYDPLNETSPVGEVLYESADGTPVCLRGNVSDIMPNMEVTVSGEGGETVYQPALSLMDGAVSIIAGKGSVYDFTPGASMMPRRSESCTARTSAIPTAWATPAATPTGCPSCWRTRRARRTSTAPSTRNTPPSSGIYRSACPAASV